MSGLRWSMVDKLSEKLSNFRRELKKLKLDGFVIPMGDEFLNEYVPDYNRRLEFVTGFTGSAGIAVIMQGEAAFFTDGRYTVQAKKELNSKDFTLFNIGEKKPLEWVADRVQSPESRVQKMSIGVDPWLHSENELRSYKKYAVKHNITIKESKNPIDKIWHDRLKPQNAHTMIHKLKYSGQASDKKIKNIASILEDNNANAIIIGLSESVCWLFNIRGNDLYHTPLLFSYAIVFSDGKANLYTDKKKINTKTKNHLGELVKVKEIEDVKGDVAKLSNKKVMIDPALSNAGLFSILKKSGAEIIESQDPCILPKACKNKVELDGMRVSHIRDGAAVCKFFYWLEKNLGKVKITETSSADKLLEFREQGANFFRPSFNTISSYGANGAIVHYAPVKGKDKKLEKRSLYLLDSGGQYYDGTTDITRTVALGKPTIEQKKHFTLVLKGHIAIATVVFPEGTSGQALDVLARQYLWQNGLDYDHGTGHGVGSFLSVHEGPQGIGKSGRVAVLKPGMVISNEPGYYLEGKYGIRIESLVAVVLSKIKAKKYLCFETITMAPIDTSLMDKNLMTVDEINWLNNYHKEVRKKISPLLDSSERKWLFRATKAI